MLASWYGIGVSLEVAGIGVVKHDDMAMVDTEYANGPLVIE